MYYCIFILIYYSILQCILYRRPANLPLPGPRARGRQSRRPAARTPWEYLCTNVS